ncbi:MAG: GGDEF domain-containing protein [Oscillospiraceae bacterium]|nr:GGDEF domain-containing protein [Oscillospiraceae bacterium]
MNSAYLYAEVNLVCCLFLSLPGLKHKKFAHYETHSRLFHRFIALNILFLLLDTAWVFVDRDIIQATIAANWGLNACYYTLCGYLAFSWFEYSETLQESSLIRNKRLHLLSFLPFAALAALILISFKTGWIFYIDSANRYHRGPAYSLQLFLSYGYVVFTAAKAFISSLHTENYRKKTQLRALAVFVLPTLLAGVLQVAFPQLPILCVGNTFGILFVYLSMQEQMISLDPLTRLNNRSQLFQYLSTKLAHPSGDKPLYLLLIDLDYFKQINDRHGHIEGDRALVAAANCLRKVCENSNYFVCRYGGDEFVAVCELEAPVSIESVCEEIREMFKDADFPYPLSASIGYALYTPDVKNQQDLIGRADRDLYRVKNNRA